MVAADLPTLQRGRPHGSRFGQRGVRQQQGFRRDLRRLFDRVLSRVRDIADHSELVTSPDRLCTEGGKPVMGNRAGLKVSDVVWRIVYELSMPDSPLVRFLKPLELRLEEIEPLYIRNNGRLSGGMRRL